MCYGSMPLSVSVRIAPNMDPVSAVSSISGRFFWMLLSKAQSCYGQASTV